MRELTPENKPLITFPCPNYPVKVVGQSGEDFLTFVFEITESFSPGFAREKTTIKSSNKGRFQSVTVFITAQGESHLKEYHQALKDNPQVKIVL